MMLRILAASLLACTIGVQAQAAPRIEHWRSDSGTPVYFIAAPQIPMLDIHLVLDAGNSRDGALPGLSRMTHALLDSGAGELDADTIAQRFEDVGAIYGSEIQLDRSSLSLRTLMDPEWRDQALETFTTVLGQPRFPEKHLERRRLQMQVALDKINEDPGAIAHRTFYQMVYPDHPYSSPASGTEDSLAAISRDDVVEFYQTFFTAAGAIVAIVGAIERAEAEMIANRITQALPQGPAPTPLPEPPTVTEAKTVTIPHPSEQAHVLIGQQGTARGESLHFPPVPRQLHPRRRWILFTADAGNPRQPGSRLFRLQLFLSPETPRTLPTGAPDPGRPGEPGSGCCLCGDPAFCGRWTEQRGA